MTNEAFGKLRYRILNQHAIKLSTKPMIYSAAVIASVLYGCKTWTVYCRHTKQVEKFHMHGLHSLLKVRWQGKVSNINIIEKAKTTSIEEMVFIAQLR